MRPAENRRTRERSQAAEFFSSFLAELSRAFRRSPFGRVTARRERRLRLQETLSLGERRMVAIVACDRREFLVAATGQTVSLLAPLEPTAAQPATGVATLGRVARAGR